MVLEKIIFKYFSYMVSPFVSPSDTRGPWFEQTWNCTMPESFHVNLNFPGQVVLEKILKWYHPIFVIISPLKRICPFIWTNWNSLHPRMICTKFDWNWPSGSGEDFLKFFSVFLLFHYYLPLEKSVSLHLNKLESPCPKDDLCQVWLKLAQWFWRSQKCESLQTDRKTDGQRAIRKAHLSFQSRWAKNAKTIT